MPQHLVKKRSHGRGFLVPLTLAAGLIALGFGCGIEQAMKNNYAFWSRFIDGIPDPAARKAAGLAYGGADPETFIEHPPYAEGSCLECHRNPTQSRLTIDDSHICLKCHEEKPTEYAKMHGPVAVGACMWCHDPHSSPLPYLLRARTPGLCLQCHAIEESVGPHADQEAATRSCLDCHVGHGGESAYYLQPEAVLPPLEPDPGPAEADDEVGLDDSAELDGNAGDEAESRSAAELSEPVPSAEGIGGY